MSIKIRRSLVAIYALSSCILVKVLCFAPPTSLSSTQHRGTAATRCKSYLSMSTNNDGIFGSPPFLAVLTEPDACDSTQRIDETVHAIERATADGGVTLVVVRVNNQSDNDTDEDNKWILLKRLSELRQHRVKEGKRNFLLVVNNEVELVLRAISSNMHVDGVHVKEYNAHMIPQVRQQLTDALNNSTAVSSNGTKQTRDIIIGTSCHSIQSALDSYNLLPRGPDYLFVGTCYLTQSHPEKTSLDQLEGPTLPGSVRKTLYQSYHQNDNGSDEPASSVDKSKPPVIFAIGGIDEENCNEPVKYGADGVATIRTVMQADDPREVVKLMNTAMLR